MFDFSPTPPASQSAFFTFVYCRSIWHSCSSALMSHVSQCHMMRWRNVSSMNVLDAWYRINETVRREPYKVNTASILNEGTFLVKYFVLSQHTDTRLTSSSLSLSLTADQIKREREDGCHATSFPSLPFSSTSVNSLEYPQADWLISTVILVVQTQFTWFTLPRMSADSLSSSSRSFYERSKGKLNISLVLAAAGMMLLGFCGVAGGKVSYKNWATIIH